MTTIADPNGTYILLLTILLVFSLAMLWIFGRK